MKYLVEIPISAKAGNELEGQKGGPGPIVNRLVETFEPEHVYMGLSERKIVMVVDIDNDIDIGAMMIAVSNMAHEYPKFIPVVAAKDFGSVVDQAMKKAHTVLGK